MTGEKWWKQELKNFNQLMALTMDKVVWRWRPNRSQEEQGLGGNGLREEGWRWVNEKQMQ